MTVLYVIRDFKKGNREMSEVLLNRREYFRIKFPQPTCGELKFFSIKGELVNSKHTPTRVKDIGGGGLKFLTNLKFPVTEEILFVFTIKMGEMNISAKGFIVRKKERKNFHMQNLNMV